MADDTAADQPGLPAHLRDDLKWKPGQSGNPSGRPKGARSILGEKFLKALLKDFEKACEEDESLGEKAIASMRAEKPNEYAKMVAGLLPKELTGEDGEPIAVANVIRLVGVRPDDDGD